MYKSIHTDHEQKWQRIKWPGAISRITGFSVKQRSTA
jgi:hypothetical protein